MLKDIAELREELVTMNRHLAEIGPLLRDLVNIARAVTVEEE